MCWGGRRKRFLYEFGLTLWGWGCQGWKTDSPCHQKFGLLVRQGMNVCNWPFSVRLWLSYWLFKRQTLGSDTATLTRQVKRQDFVGQWRLILPKSTLTFPTPASILHANPLYHIRSPFYFLNPIQNQSLVYGYSIDFTIWDLIIWDCTKEGYLYIDPRKGSQAKVLQWQVAAELSGQGKPFCRCRLQSTTIVVEHPLLGSSDQNTHHRLLTQKNVGCNLCVCLGFHLLTSWQIVGRKD